MAKMLSAVRAIGEKNAENAYGVKYPGHEHRFNFYIGKPGTGQMHRDVVVCGEPFFLTAHSTIVGSIAKGNGQTFADKVIHRCGKFAYGFDFKKEEMSDEPLPIKGGKCSFCDSDIDANTGYAINKLDAVLIVPLLIRPYQGVGKNGEEVKGPYLNLLELRPYGHQQNVMEEMILPVIVSHFKKHGTAIGTQFTAKRYKTDAKSIGNAWVLNAEKPLMPKNLLMGYLKKNNDAEKNNLVPKNAMTLYPAMDATDADKVIKAHCQIAQAHSSWKETGLPAGAAMSNATDLSDIDLGDGGYGDDIFGADSGSGLEDEIASVEAEAVEETPKVLDFGEYGLLDAEGNQYNEDGEPTGETVQMTEEDTARFDDEDSVFGDKAFEEVESGSLEDDIVSAEAEVEGESEVEEVEAEIIEEEPDEKVIDAEVVSPGNKVTGIDVDPANEDLRYVNFDNGTREPIVKLTDCEGNFVDIEGHIYDAETGEPVLDEDGDHDAYEMTPAMKTIHKKQWASAPKSSPKKASKKVAKKASKKVAKKTVSKPKTAAKKTVAKKTVKKTSGKSAFDPTAEELAAMD